jgi:haloacetate dehalogenase
MQELGFDRFSVAGHDRGGRVASRLAIDYPKQISRLAVLDVAPTLTMYERTNMEIARKYVWWFFQIQPFPVPEYMIGLDAKLYLREDLKVQNKTPGAVTDAALAEYIRCYCAKATIHAACEDYRAAAGIGLQKERQDALEGKKITAPLLRCGEPREQSVIFTMYSPLGVPPRTM